MATHSSTLVWRNPGTEEPGGVKSQSMGLQRVGHDRVTKHIWNQFWLEILSCVLFLRGHVLKTFSLL